MRALILRRVGLLETGAGRPVIVGRAENGDVLRLEGFLRRNGHPRQRLDSETDPEAKALIERLRPCGALFSSSQSDFDGRIKGGRVAESIATIALTNYKTPPREGAAVSPTRR